MAASEGVLVKAATGVPCISNVLESDLESGRTLPQRIRECRDLQALRDGECDRHSLLDELARRGVAGTVGVRLSDHDTEVLGLGGGEEESDQHAGVPVGANAVKVAKAVFDVTGAGDTVVAMLALARASGVDMHSSIQLANLAAGITVGRFGTYAVSRQELLAMLGQVGRGKILTEEEAVSVAAQLRADGKRLVFTNGCFDILHAGHIDYLIKAKEMGDILIVAINSDSSVKRIKGDSRPVTPEQERLLVVSNLNPVDYVTIFEEDTPFEIITLKFLTRIEIHYELNFLTQREMKKYGKTEIYKLNLSMTLVHIKTNITKK